MFGYSCNSLFLSGLSLHVEPEGLLVFAKTGDKWSAIVQDLYDYALENFHISTFDLRLYEQEHVFIMEMRVARVRILRCSFLKAIFVHSQNH